MMGRRDEKKAEEVLSNCLVLNDAIEEDDDWWVRKQFDPTTI